MASFVRLFLLAVLVGLAGCAKAPPPPAAVTQIVAEGDAELSDDSAGETAVASVSLADDSAPPITQLAEPATRTQTSTAAVWDKVARAGAAETPKAGYTIGAGDILEITVFQVADLTKTIPVGEGGTITFPLIGEVAAAGETPAELEIEISQRLEAQFLQSADVSVYVRDAVSRRVTVEGAVAKPGVYPTAENATLLQVIALAGGLDRVADYRGVVIFRNVEGKRQAAKFDYKAVRSGTADDPVILAGDVVVVDESGGKAAFRNLRESLSLFGLFTPFI